MSTPAELQEEIRRLREEAENYNKRIGHWAISSMRAYHLAILRDDLLQKALAKAAELNRLLETTNDY
jgi:hypothetical protein